jgi:lipopolysaccharide transport system ATP-binding protein
VDRRFDEIVAFAEVENFIETPVKHYSSGMYVRLAFSVAAHLETEILLVDEVLAVGDLQFQKKCLGKMGDVTHEGRTVLFVSHNMQAIKTFCSRTLLIENGRLEADGPTKDVLFSYLTKNNTLKGDGDIPEDAPRPVGTGEILLRSVALKAPDGTSTNRVFFGQKFHIEAVFNSRAPVDDAAIEIGISTFDGLRIATVTSIDRAQPLLSFTPGAWKITIETVVTLLPGQYAVDVMIHHWGEERKLTIDWVERALTFTALDTPESGSDYYVSFAIPYSLTQVRGFVRPETVWQKPLQLKPLAGSVI